MVEEFAIHVPGLPEEGIPRVKALLRRITVVLGTNGAGKTHLLRHLADKQRNAFAGRTPVFVEGGRIVQFPRSVGTSGDPFTFLTPDAAEAEYRGQLNTKLAARVSSALSALERKTQIEKARHSDAVARHQENNAPGPAPRRREPPLDAVFRRFNEIFPRLRLFLEPKQNALSVERAGQSYNANGLSDGERQVFALLADTELCPKKSVFFVDEPELNLDPLLANTLWDTLQTELADSVFVYATHSIGFAMRRSVERVVVLASDDAEVLAVDDMQEVPTERARTFLGSLPGILSASYAVAVEGDETSFDRPFYRWLAGPDVEVVPLGSSEEVRAATGGREIWDRLTNRTATIIGVVDRDYRDDDTLSELPEACVCLAYHEAESYLCEPDLLADLAQALGTIDVPPSAADIREAILSWAAEAVLSVSVRRASEQLAIRLGASIPRRALAKLGTVDEAKDYLAKSGEGERAKAAEKLGEGSIEKVLQHEHRRTKKAVDEGDLPAVLRLFPGKELLAALASRIGCANAGQVVLAASRHLEFAKYEELSNLAATLRTFTTGRRR